ncbi:hypothetical protein U9M48_040617 [Paspalum notatum var. saurae]|uniref:Uncharacterized protein n=1 Tax=Paspalum notatum var. saurae TaxID=547442 RepID=A0AAQ3URG6_PASNO
MLTIRPTAPDAESRHAHDAESRHAHDAGSRRQPRLAAAHLQKEKLTQPPPPSPCKSSKKGMDAVKRLQNGFAQFKAEVYE